MFTDTPVTPSPASIEIFWENHRQKIMTVMIAALIFFLVAMGGLLWRHSERIAATNLFANAKDKAGWQAVIHRYPHSGAAANALLLLADAERKEHNIEASNATYAQFSKKFPHYPLAISALLGRAMNDDSLGHPEQALNEFQQAATAYPQSYGAPVALFLKARLLARLGKTNEAKRVIQILSNQYPNSLVTSVMLKQEAGRLK